MRVRSGALAALVAAQRRFPGVLVTTPPLTGFSDAHFVRSLGIANVEFGTRYFFEILREIAGQ